MITEDIIKQAQAGDSEAFAMIYNETIKTAYYVAKRILLDEDATEDVLQEAYIAVFNHLSDYKTGNLQGWIDTIVANRAKNYLRRKNPILFSEMETEENPVVEFEEEKMEFRPDEKVDYNETQRLILEMVDNLSPEQRLSIMLFYFEDKSVKEIAEICECSENTVKSRLNYARKKIKEDVLELEKKGTKLYSVSIIPFLIWLLSEKAKASMVTESVASKVFSGVCTSVNSVANVVANTAVNAATNTVANAAGNMVGNTIANTAVNAAVGGAAKVVAGKVGMALSVKLTLAIASVAVATTAVVGTVVVVQNNGGKTSDYVYTTEQSVEETTTIDDFVMIPTEEPTTEEPTTEETVTEELTTEDTTTEEAEKEGWACLEGTYICDYDGGYGPLIISNVEGDVYNLNDITFDVEYSGQMADEVIIEDDIIKLTFNYEDGNKKVMELSVWDGFVENDITGKLLELVDYTTYIANGNVASMNNVAPVIFSQYLANNMDSTANMMPLVDGKYEQDISQVNGTQGEYIYSITMESTDYGNFSERVVTITIHDNDGQLIDTLTSDSFNGSEAPSCTFWARSTVDGIFVCRLERMADSDLLVLNCYLRNKDYRPDWYDDGNLNAYVSLVGN